MAPVTAAAMSGVPHDKAGVGSAVLNSMRQVGGSLGIAIMGAIVAASVTAAPGTGGHPTPSSFLDGFHHALVTAAVISVAGAVLAALTLSRPAQRQAEPVVAELVG
jgi:hypothetical protein